MKLFKYIALITLLPQLVFAQALPIRNDTPSNLRDLGSNLQVGRNFSVDQKGKILLGAPGTGATDLGKAEDAPHTSGDTGVACLGLRNDSVAVTTNTDLDYQLPSYTNRGIAWSLLADGNSASTLNKAEDQASGDGQGLIIAGFVREDALTVNTNTTGDYTWAKTDSAGRLIVGNAPAGEMWASCGTATATTGDVAIKAAVASNRIYVTSITCKNTSSTTGTNLDFKDGTTIIAVGSIGEFTIAAANNGVNTYPITFPTPLRLTSATAFNFATNTSISSVTCCAAGFISVA